MSPSNFLSASLSVRDAPTSVTLSRGQSIGLVLDTAAGLFSSIFALAILALIFRRLYNSDKPINGVDIFVIALFAAEVVQGLGHATEMKWVIEGKLHTGTFCSAQGALQQLGEVGVALATLNIAVQTFVTIWWLKSPNKVICLATVAVEWLFVILFVAIAFGIHTRPGKEYYAAPALYWCWLGQGFIRERIAGQYVWFWLTLLVSIVLYLPLIFYSRIRAGESWYLPNKPELKSNTELNGHSVEMNTVGDGDVGPSQAAGIQDETAPSQTTVDDDEDISPWKILSYPIVYSVMVLPLSAIRWMYFSHHNVTDVETFSVAIIYSLSGIWNTVLYLWTRGLLIFGRES